ncbi:MAG: BT_3928 family protein [Bacteroidales bacterium]
MKIIRNISRILAGLVFMFSGFVKGVDPWGFAYKLMDYYEAFSLEWLDPTALYVSVIVSALEFVIGFALVFNARPKLAAWGNLLFMVFFTPLTLYLAIANPVSDCGCFGDAIIMTNWETFFKNIVLLIFAIIIFRDRQKFTPYWNKTQQSVLVFIGVFILISLSWYSYQHLPILDFRAWKVGSKMIEETPKPEVYLIYKNKETGETKEWLSDDLPYDKPEFNEKWEFVDQRTEEKDRPEKTLLVEDKKGNNVSEKLFTREGYTFILIAHTLEQAHEESMITMDKFYDQCREDSIGFHAITGDLFKESSAYKQQLNLDYPFYLADDIALKTIIRSNPGLILLKDGIILEKWHYNDFPKYRYLKKEYLNLSD